MQVTYKRNPQGKLETYVDQGSGWVHYTQCSFYAAAKLNKTPYDRSGFFVFQLAVKRGAEVIPVAPYEDNSGVADVNNIEKIYDELVEKLDNGQ